MFTPGGQIDHLTFAGMRGGGKGGGGSFPMTQQLVDATTGKTYKTPEELNKAIDDRQAAADAKAAKDKADADTLAQTNETAFQGRKSTAYNDALNSILSTFKGAGVDPTNYMAQYITPALTSAMNKVPDLAPDLSAYFPSTLGATILNQATGDRRTNLLNTLNQTFTPNYSMNALPESTLDAPINDILNQQFDPLTAQLQNAQKRGVLDPTGYAAALKKMGTERTSAGSNLRTLGENILNTDRSGLDTLANSARTDISGAALGQGIDPASYGSQAAEKTKNYLADFPGALQAASSGVTFGDITDLLNAGGAVQGGINPVASAGTIGAGGGGTTAVDDTTKRGLGSTGAF